MARHDVQTHANDESARRKRQPGRQSNPPMRQAHRGKHGTTQPRKKESESQVEVTTSFGTTTPPRLILLFFFAILSSHNRLFVSICQERLERNTLKGNIARARHPDGDLGIEVFTLTGASLMVGPRGHLIFVSLAQHATLMGCGFHAGTLTGARFVLVFLYEYVPQIPWREHIFQEGNAALRRST